MLQTIWDASQQVIRILLYAVSGGLVTKGIIDTETSVAFVGAAMGLLNGVWTWYWNRRNVATVGGLERAGMQTAAAAIDIAKLEGVASAIGINVPKPSKNRK